MYYIFNFIVFWYADENRYGDQLWITEDMQGYSVWTWLAYNDIWGDRYELTGDIEINVGK